MDMRDEPIGVLLMRIARMRRHLLEETMRELGVTPSQHYLLMQLSRTGAAPSQTEMAEMLHVSPASVARTIKSLDADGYIQRNSCGEDNRRNEIRITEKGERVVSRSLEIFRRIEAASLDGFAPAELGAFSGLLERLLENLSRQEAEIKRR